MQKNENKEIHSDTHNLFGTQNEYAQMFQMIFGFNVSQIVYAAALYSLPDYLANGSSTPEAIAKAESLNVDATFRLMRACASIGLMTYDGQSNFASTPLLDTLRKDNSQSLRALTLVQASSSHWLPWGRFGHAIKTGEPQAVAALGRGVWEHLSETPAEAAAFVDAMKSSSLVFNRDAVRLIDTRSVGVAADIGGASGTLIHALMEANYSLTGLVFDLPHVAPTAIEAAEELGLQDRFSVVNGDFFTSELPSADLYLLKLILHDWNDEACLKILKNCRRAINPGGRIVVVELLLEEIGTPGLGPLMDLTMLVVLGGRERNLEQYKGLLAMAGFHFSSVTPTTTPFVLIEAIAH